MSLIPRDRSIRLETSTSSTNLHNNHTWMNILGANAEMLANENINKMPTACESWEERFPLVIKKGLERLEVAPL